VLSLAGLSFVGASGCANSDAGSRVAAKAAVAGPEQVVQRIEPAPVAAAPVAPASPAPPSPAAVASGAAAAATPEAAKSPSEPPPSAEPITSKHLEAELNRLEAELR
jgi:hypothetical protein